MRNKDRVAGRYVRGVSWTGEAGGGGGCFFF